MAARDPSSVDAALVALVRELSRKSGKPSDEAEIRAALAPLHPDEEKALKRAASSAARAPRGLGAFAWADVARGVDPEIAAARELGGYYAMQAERDALAAMVHGAQAAARAAPSKPPAPVEAPEADEEDDEPPPPPKPRAKPRNEETRKAAEAAVAGEKPAKAPKRKDAPRAEQILGLFTYYRDVPRVAQELRVALVDLEKELDELGIRRKAMRLTKGTDFDLPVARVNAEAPSGPTVRRRTKAERAAPASKRPAPSEKEVQAAELKRMLSFIGPRRSVLAERLGTAKQPVSDAVLLAKFRAAGLEREFALRERDLLLALYAKEHGSEPRIAAELKVTPVKLKAIVRERGLSREIDKLCDGYRREVRNRGWPKGRIEQVLHRRDYLKDLGVYEELEREVITRTRVAWAELKKQPKALDALAKAFDLTRADAEKLQRLADLR